MRIKQNVLLRGAEKTLSLEEALAWKGVFSLQGIELPEFDARTNLCSVSEQQLKDIHRLYGPGGLYRLYYLAHSHAVGEFRHFFRLISEEIKFGRSGALDSLAKILAELVPGAPAWMSQGGGNAVWDNQILPQSRELDRFNSHILQPSLSRKLYNPGVHPGYLVHGLGGPKILISHPFRGVNGELYDVFTNCVDVVTSLWARGYFGTFLFLDNLVGLNFEMEGVPAWLLWFSMIASHSDAVFFIKEFEEGFTGSQEREIGFTPDRVQKKIIEIPKGELIWAKEYESASVDFYVAEGVSLTREEAFEREAEHARLLLRGYSMPGIPKDRIVRMEENGNASHYPLNFPIYGPSVD
ncbi:hypothetical protein [Streptomyces sp. NPDC002889]|uniref:hypothetical protein n=1 Tax=Streptomyces sp. NPDC002889 TaxID=3364669 RepID=UPI0036CFA48B